MLSIPHQVLPCIQDVSLAGDHEADARAPGQQGTGARADRQGGVPTALNYTVCFVRGRVCDCRVLPGAGADAGVDPTPTLYVHCYHPGAVLHHTPAALTIAPRVLLFVELPSRPCRVPSVCPCS